MANLELGKIGRVGKKETLLQKGTIEDLTRQGRVVTIWEGESWDMSDPTDRRRGANVFIPPPGVTFGDRAWMYPLGGYEFFIAGKSVGYSELITVSLKQGDKIRRRKNRVLESLGRKGTYSYEGVCDEDIYRFHGKDRVHAKALTRVKTSEN